MDTKLNTQKKQKQKKPTPKLETEVQAEICKYLDEQKDLFFFRLNNIPAFSRLPNGKMVMRKLPKHTPAGLPDIVVVRKGMFYALEVKREMTSSKQSPDQKKIEEQIKSKGGKYYVVRSVQDVKMIPL